MNLKNEYLKIVNRYDVKSTLQKWKPVLENRITINNDFFYEKISIFCETYSLVLDNIPRSLTPLSFSPFFSPSFNPPSFTSNIKPELPEGVFELPVAIDFIVDNLKMYISEDSITKLKIVEEYYNTITGKKGILLENDVRVEDGKILNQKHQEKVDNEIKRNIEQSIEFILNFDFRKRFKRKNKLERILKDI